MIKEFKDFIAKGNVMDMAVGIIIGAAFTAIVTSLVGDLINPIISPITGEDVSESSFFPDSRKNDLKAAPNRAMEKRKT